MSNDNYATDQWIMELFEDWFDPCPLNLNPQENGLTIDWKDKTFVNPPYSSPLNWVEKAIYENSKGKTIALLLRVDTSTQWFARLVEEKAKILWINKRLRHRTGKPANFSSMLVILNKKSEGEGK